MLRRLPLLALAAALALAASTATAEPGAQPWIVFAAHPQGGTQPSQLFRVRADGTGARA